MNKKIIVIAAIVLAIGAISSFFGLQDRSLTLGAGDRTTVGNPWTFSDAVTFGSTISTTGAVTFSSTAGVGGKLTLDGGQLRSYTNSTSTTATSYTAVQADILNYDTILLRPNTGSLTFTFPATSTLTSMVPTAGDRQDTCFVNSTSTAAATIVFAAGSGIDLETSSSSPTDLTLLAQNTACFTFIRKVNTDISALMTEYTDGD